MRFSFSSVLKIADQVKLFPTLETGGLLVGHGDLVLYNLPAGNVAPEQAVEFAIDPVQFDALLVDAVEAEGLELLGTYHSHPSGNGQMSTADAAASQATGLLLIVAPGQEWDWRLWDPIERGEVELAICPPWTTHP